jgi:glucose/arabinose dehydrogenase
VSLTRHGRLAVASALLILTGCTTACTTASSESSSDTRTGGATASDTGSVTELVTGLNTPWGLIELSEGSFLISERDTARILRVDNGQATPVRTIEGARPGGEGGLLGIAMSPDSKTVFAYFTTQDDNRVVSMPWDGQALGEPVVILSGIPAGGIHDGGRMIVGPDGLLYISTGDSGDSNHAQDKESLGGKILRVSFTGKSAPGNPFGNEVYSYGHRNIQGLAFDDAGRLWASEFGTQSWDELNLITEGGNYGWPMIEGSSENREFINPKVVWETSDASPSGLAYWRGDLWMAALRGERLWQIPLQGTTTGEPQAHYVGSYGRLRTVTASKDGNSLLLTTSNTDGRGNVKPGDDRLLRVSQQQRG